MLVAYLIIHIANVLLSFAVHVENLQEGFVHPFICCKARLHNMMTALVAGKAANAKLSMCKCTQLHSIPLIAGAANAYLDFVNIVDCLIKLHRLLGLHGT